MPHTAGHKKAYNDFMQSQPDKDKIVKSHTKAATKAGQQRTTVEQYKSTKPAVVKEQLVPGSVKKTITPNVHGKDVQTQSAYRPAKELAGGKTRHTGGAGGSKVAPWVHVKGKGFVRETGTAYGKESRAGGTAPGGKKSLPSKGHMIIKEGGRYKKKKKMTGNPHPKY